LLDLVLSEGFIAFQVLRAQPDERASWHERHRCEKQQKMSWRTEPVQKPHEARPLCGAIVSVVSRRLIESAGAFDGQAART